MCGADEWADALWVEMVTDVTLHLGVGLDPHEMRSVAVTLSKYPNWRQLSPADAALKMLQPPAGPESP